MGAEVAYAIQAGADLANTLFNKPPDTRVSARDKRFTTMLMLQDIDKKTGALDAVISAKRQMQDLLTQTKSNMMGYGAQQQQKILAGTGSPEAQLSGLGALIAKSMPQLYGLQSQNIKDMLGAEQQAIQQDTQKRLTLQGYLAQIGMTPSKHAAYNNDWLISQGYGDYANSQPKIYLNGLKAVAVTSTGKTTRNDVRRYDV